MALGLKQNELARAMKTKQPYISYLENGGADDCSLRTLRKLALVLNLKLEVNLNEQKPQGAKAAGLGFGDGRTWSSLDCWKSTFTVSTDVETASTGTTITTDADYARS